MYELKLTNDEVAVLARVLSGLVGAGTLNGHDQEVLGACHAELVDQAVRTAMDEAGLL